MLKLLEDMHMTHTKYVCCCHALDEDACKVLGCDSKTRKKKYSVKNATFRQNPSPSNNHLVLKFDWVTAKIGLTRLDWIKTGLNSVEIYRVYQGLRTTGV